MENFHISATEKYCEWKTGLSTASAYGKVDCDGSYLKNQYLK